MKSAVRVSRREVLVAGGGWCATALVGVGHVPVVAAARPSYGQVTHLLPPFVYLRDGQLAGYAIELTLLMAPRLSQPLAAPTVVPFARGLAEATRTENSAFFVVARRPERETSFQWVGPIYESDVYIYVRKDRGLLTASREDLKALPSIGVARHNADHAHLAQQGFANLHVTNDQRQCLLMLDAGRIDATPMSAAVFAALSSELGWKPDHVVPLGGPLYQSDLHFVFSKLTAPSVVTEWQQALRAVKASADWAALQARYGTALGNLPHHAAP